MYALMYALGSPPSQIGLSGVPDHRPGFRSLVVLADSRLRRSRPKFAPLFSFSAGDVNQRIPDGREDLRLTETAPCVRREGSALGALPDSTAVE